MIDFRRKKLRLVQNYSQLLKPGSTSLVIVTIIINGPQLSIERIKHQALLHTCKTNMKQIQLLQHTPQKHSCNISLSNSRNAKYFNTKLAFAFCLFSVC